MISSLELSRLKSVWFAGCAIGMTLAALSSGTAKAAEFGLALISMQAGPYDDPTDCPDGMTLNPEQIYLQTLSPEKRKEAEERDKKAGSVAAYLTRILSDRRTPDGKDACEAPTEYKDPPMKIGQSKVSFGFNLDGGDTTTHCEHQKFMGADGQTGIDNQVARLTACISSQRKNAGGAVGGGGLLGVATLVYVSNVHDMKNDDNVRIDIYKSANKFIKDGSGKPLPDVTLIADENAQMYHASTHGKIVNGVLTTEPVDAHIMPDYFLRGARLQLILKPDGGAEGILAGYDSVDSFWDAMARNGGQQQGAGYSCPALYEALHRLADGYKDPKTGQCTAISAAYHVKAIPAFVVPPKGGPA